MKILGLIVSAVFALLGGLWLLQGLGVLHIEPVLCAADCEPIEGASRAWAVIGLVVFSAGALGLLYSIGRLRQK